MAKKETAPKKEGADKEDNKPKKEKPILLIAIIGILVLMNGIGAALFLMKGNNDQDQEQDESHVEEQKKVKAIYFSLDPAFVVNFKDENSKSHYLQLKITVMHRDPRIDEMLKANAPLIRNNLLVLLSGQNFGKLQSQEGKTELAEAALDEVQSILQDEEGDDTIVIERILFNDFVMQ